MYHLNSTGDKLLEIWIGEIHIGRTHFGNRSRGRISNEKQQQNTAKHLQIDIGHHLMGLNIRSSMIEYIVQTQTRIVITIV